MVADKKFDKKGSDAVKKLRLKKFSEGHPFMINSKDLPGDQCYLEYPEGFINLVHLSRTAQEFEVIRTLSGSEATTLKHKFQLD